MDLTETIAPRSDQLNSDDLMAGPRTFTIAGVREGSAEQPVNVDLVELPGRPYRPSKSMRRVMVSIWGAQAATYADKRFTLYRDPEVTFGKDKVGGIKISHMSHLDQRSTLMLTATRGRRAPHVVEPLPDSAPVSRSVSAETLAELEQMFVRKGIPADAQLGGANRITGGNATDLEVITEDQARQVLDVLAGRPDTGAE